MAMAIHDPVPGKPLRGFMFHPVQLLSMTIYSTAQDRMCCGLAAHAAMLVMQVFSKDPLILET